MLLKLTVPPTHTRKDLRDEISKEDKKEKNLSKHFNLPLCLIQSKHSLDLRCVLIQSAELVLKEKKKTQKKDFKNIKRLLC